MNIEAQKIEKHHSIPSLESYFLGETRAWGLFEDRFGTLRRRFVVDIVGRVEGDRLFLDESFTFSDGEREHRQWRIDRVEDGSYVGHADGVIGSARGTQQDNVLNWSYLFNLEVQGRKIRVKFDDRMCFEAGGVMLNRATISKFGIELGTVFIAFFKPSLLTAERAGDALSPIPVDVVHA